MGNGVLMAIMMVFLLALSCCGGRMEWMVCIARGLILGWVVQAACAWVFLDLGGVCWLKMRRMEQDHVLQWLLHDCVCRLRLS
jgi:hypothetical protein